MQKSKTINGSNQIKTHKISISNMNNFNNIYHKTKIQTSSTSSMQKNPNIHKSTSSINIMHNNSNKLTAQENGSSITKKFAMSHLSYEFISKPQLNNILLIENQELKHDVLLLITQLKEKDKIIETLKEDKHKSKLEIENNFSNNKVTELTDKISDLEKKNKVLIDNDNFNQKIINRQKDEIKELNLKIYKLEKFINSFENVFNHNISIKEQENLNPPFDNIQKCAQDIPCSNDENIIEENTVIKSRNSKNIIYNHLSKYKFPISKSEMFPTTNSHLKPKTLFFKPYDSSRLLQYDITSNSFKLITFKDYSNYSQNYKENGTRYTTINNILYVITGANYDKLFTYNNSNQTMKHLSTLNANHINCGLVKYYNNSLLCLSGNYTKTVELFLLNKNNKWDHSTIPEMSNERAQASFVIYNNIKIFALYGYDFIQSRYLNDIDYFDGSDWNVLNVNYTQEASWFKGVKNHISLCVNEIIYIYGGKMQNGEICEYIKIDLNGLKGEVVGGINNKGKVITFSESLTLENGMDFIYGFDDENNIHKFSKDQGEI